MAAALRQLSRHRSHRRRRHQPRVLRQHAGLIPRRRRRPRRQPRRDLARRSAPRRAGGSPRRSRSMSPSRSAAIGPPRDASGATWPTMKPRVAPEKRPSVTSATESPSPAPTIAAVTAEHLAHARAAGRPFVADHDDVAGLDRLPLHRLERRSSLSNTRAGPRCCARSVPDSLSTAPSGARLPKRITRPPCGLSGRSIGRTTSWPGVSARLRRFLGQRPAGDRRRVAVDRARLDQPLDHERAAAGRVQVGGDEAAGRLQVGDERRLRADAIEVGERQLDAGLAARSPAGAARRWSIRRSPRRPRSRSRSRARVMMSRGRSAGATSFTTCSPAARATAGLRRIGGRHAAAAERARCRAPRRRSPSCSR